MHLRAQQIFGALEPYRIIADLKLPLENRSGRFVTPHPQQPEHWFAILGNELVGLTYDSPPPACNLFDFLALQYETANGLAMDVQRHLKQEVVLARPPSRLYRLQKLVYRNKLAFAAVAITSLALFSAAAFSTWQALRASQQARLADAGRREADSNRRQAILAQKRAEAGEQAARQNLYAADMSLAQQTMLEGNWGRARSLLEASRPQPGQPDLRGFEWRYLWSAMQGDELDYVGTNRVPVSSLAVSPDGQTLVAIGQEGPARVIDLRSHKTRGTITNAGGAYPTVAFSPDGQTLAVGTSEDVGGEFVFKRRSATGISHGSGFASRNVRA